MKRRLPPRFIFILTILIGLSAFFCIPILIGVGKIFGIIATVGWMGVIVFCLNGLITMIAPALGWKIIINRDNVRIPYWDLLKANFMGYPVNFLTPSMYLGSEPLRTFYIAHNHHLQRRKVLASVIVSKFQELSGIVLLCFIGAIVILFTGVLSTRATLLVLGAILCSMLVVSGLLYIFLGGFKPTTRVVDLLGKFRLFSGKLKELRVKAQEVDELVYEAFTKRWKAFFAAQVVTLLSAASIFIRPAIFLYFYGETKAAFHIPTLAVVFVLSQILCILPLIPGALGIFDWGMIGIFTLIQLSPAEAFSFALITRISDVLLFLIGFTLMIHYGLTYLIRARRIEPANNYNRSKG
jgi:uncharacterized protein (TIRG00374 family)